MGILQNAVLDTGTRRLTKEGLAALSGPVRTYRPGEIEWCPSKQTTGKQSKPAITVSHRGVGVSRAAFRLMGQAACVAEAVAQGRPVHLNLGYDAMARAVVIQPDPAGRFVISAKTSSPKFGGPLTAAWLEERGLELGTYPVTWDGQRLVVGVGRR